MLFINFYKFFQDRFSVYIVKQGDFVQFLNIFFHII